MRFSKFYRTVSHNCHFYHVQLDSSDAESVRRDSQPDAWTIAGLRRLLLIVVDFEDEQVACSHWDLSKRIWGKVSPSFQNTAGPWESVYRSFQVNSVNRAQFVRNATNLGSDPKHPIEEVRDIVGPYRLRRQIRTESTCAYDAWASEAMEMAQKDGVPLGLYTQYSFVLPNSAILHTSLCRWSGLAHVGCGFQCKSWISDCGSLGVFTHELGHNAGLSHSGSWWSFGNSLVEYADPTAIMGNLWGARRYANNDFYFAAPQRAMLGWIPSSQYLTIASRQAPAFPTSNLKRDAEDSDGDDVDGSLNDAILLVDENPPSDFKRHELVDMPPFPAPNQYGVIYNETHYRISSPAVAGQKISPAQVFHRDGSYFNPSTARIFRLTPHHLENVPQQSDSISYKALKIMKLSGSASYWISFQVGRSVLAQSALVHFLGSTPSTQTYIVQTIVPSHNPALNVSLLEETTLFFDQDHSFAARVLRTSETIMDVQITWLCEYRPPLITVVPTPPSPTSVSIPSSSSSTSSSSAFIHFSPGQERDIATISVNSLSQRLSFTLNVTNMNSDLCRPLVYEFAYEIPPEVNVTCSKPDLGIGPGDTCQLPCEIAFLKGMPDSSINITTIQRASDTGVLESTSVTEIRLISGGCQRILPSITSNIFAATASPSTPASFGLTIQNKDSSSCTSRNFAVSHLIDNQWAVQLDRSIPSLSPGQSFFLRALVSPKGTITPLPSDSNGTISAWTTFFAHGRDELVEKDSMSHALAMITYASSCVRSEPLVEMENFDVAFYVRNAAIAPVRVTNMDSGLCPPLTVSLGLIPDPTGIIQSAFYPNSMNLKPGESFDFPLVVMTPDFGPEPGGSFRTTTDIKLSYNHPSTSMNAGFIEVREQMVEKIYAQTSWTVDSPCIRKEPSTLFSCPTHVAVYANTQTVLMPCTIGVRNNDAFQCEDVKFNLSVNAVTLNISSIPDGYMDGTYLIGNLTLNDDQLNLVAGVTIFDEFLIRANVTGLFSQFKNSSNSVQNAMFQLRLDIDSVNTNTSLHHTYIETEMIYFGLCAIYEPATVLLSPHTGPYNWIEIEHNSTEIAPIEPPPVDIVPEFVLSPDFNETTDPPPVIGEEPLPFEPLSNVTREFLNSTSNSTAYPVVAMAWGITKTVNWTIYNPMTPYCNKLLFTPLIHPSSEKLLKDLNIKYSFKAVNIGPKMYDNVTLEFTTSTNRSLNLPLEFDGLVNITTRVRWVLNASEPHNFSPWTTFFLNVTGDCIVRKTSLVTADPLELFPANRSISSGPLDSLIFNVSDPINIWAVVNLTNMDSSSCNSDFWNITTRYTFSVRRSWPVARFPFAVSIRPIEIDGTTTPNMTTGVFDLAPGQSQLLNLTIIAPSSLDPMFYAVSLVVSSEGRPEHQSIYAVTFRIVTAPPVAPQKVTAFEIKNSIGVSIGHDIVWRACEKPSDCSCPCKYHVYLNDELVASQPEEFTNYYAHRYSISQAGVYTTAKIVIEDRFGRRTSPYSCESSVSYTPSDSKYAHLFILFVLIGVMFFPLIVLFFEWLRYMGQLPLANLVFDDSDGEDEL